MKRIKHLRVPVFDDESKAIKKAASEAGLSVAAYLRNVGQGYRINSIVDYKSIDELSRINADLARLGNLMKMVLTNDNRVKYFGESHIYKIMDNLTAMQKEMKSVMATILRKRSV